MLELRDISRQFGGLAALTKVNLTVPNGKVVGLIGPNGAGKTTLINLISGLDHPTSGAITFDDALIHGLKPHQIARRGIARTYQNIRMFGEMTVLENLLIAQHKRGNASALESLIYAPRFRKEEKELRERAMTLLGQFNLADKATLRARTLPYGDQRRLEMARALATAPKLMLLDEPTAGMNPVETEELGGHILALREAGISVLVIEHDMSLIAQVCEEVYVLNFGQIIAHGTHEQVKTNPLVIQAYLGEEEKEDADGAA